MTKVTGMRKGLSLVEMMIAIILFGVISVVGFQYYKNFMNTDLTAKKARVAALMDQATQLSNAYDVYSAQFGTAPSVIGDLTSNEAMILTALPPAITEIGAAQWTMDTAQDYTETGNNDIAFVYTVDDVASSPDNEEYCAIFNNLIDSSISVNKSDTDTFQSSKNIYDSIGRAFCFSSNAGYAAADADAADGLQIVILKEVN